MAPKTIKIALVEILEDLGDENFQRFRNYLRDRREEPRVRRNKVEGKNYWEIADVLVSTFTEAKSVAVAQEILRQIGCCEEAKMLDEYNKDGAGPKAGTDGPKPGAAASNTCSKVHFVDKHRRALIERVSNIDPILDELLDEKVIQQEQYNKIRALPTSEEKMRELCSGPLQTAEECKDVFYRSLETNEKYLVLDLKKNN